MRLPPVGSNSPGVYLGQAQRSTPVTCGAQRSRCAVRLDEQISASNRAKEARATNRAIDPKTKMSNVQVERPPNTAQLAERAHNRSRAREAGTHGSRSAPTKVRRTSRIASAYNDKPRSLLLNTTVVDMHRRIRGSTNLSTNPLREPSRRALSPR
jgi:hypothetical protein